MRTPSLDPDAPLLVAKATGTLALLGAATGGTLAVLRAHPWPLGTVFTMGLNGAVAGLSFFGASLPLTWGCMRYDMLTRSG